jgi:PAS domain S-box-containing protein
VGHAEPQRPFPEDVLPAPGLLLAALPVAMALICSVDGHLVYVNQAWERLFGYEPGELVGRHISVVDVPDPAAPRQRADRIITALERDGAWQGDVENVRKDGTRFWSAASVRRFDDPAIGAVWVAVHTDITARKRAELWSVQAAEHYRDAFEQAPVGLVSISDNGRVLDVNEALCAMVGYPAEALVGMALPDLIHPDDRAADAVAADRLLRSEIQRHRGRQRWITRSGEAIAVSYSISVVRDPAGRGRWRLLVVEPARQA